PTKTVAAISHGAQVLIDARMVSGRLLTSDPSLRGDLENAGAEWVDYEVVTDSGLVTGRNTDDLPTFLTMLSQELAEKKSDAVSIPRFGENDLMWSKRNLR